jgi:hypothetical protein
MTRASRWLLLGWALACAFARPAGAAEGSRRSEIAHELASGETFEALAQEYYGDPEFAELLRRHNDARGTGDRSPVVRVPTARIHSVREGDTWSSIAATYWGDPALGRALASQLGVDPGSTPEAGASLQIPGLVEWKIRKGESLAVVSRHLYGTPDRTRQIAGLSAISEPSRVRVGDRVRAPFLVHARVSEAGSLPDTDRGPDDPAPVPPPISPPAQATGPGTDGPSAPVPVAEPVSATPSSLTEEDRHTLRSGVNAYLEGSYEEALERLEEIRGSVLARGDDGERTLLLRHLVFLYVAFDRLDDACGPYLALRRIDPEGSLDPDEVSPKVRSAVASCGDP